MVFPKFKNKHLEDAIFNPCDSLDLEKIPRKLPKRFILMYSEDQLRYLEKKYKPKIVSDVSKELYKLYTCLGIGIARINGIGSPHAAAVLDDLIFLGGNIFVNVGCAGGLIEGGVFLCNKSIRDEGTSYHYLPDKTYSYSDKTLTGFLRDSLKRQALEFKEGPNWTTDAPYRETFKEIESYRKDGVLTVDMEVSALFAVAEFRKVRMAAAFVVSDILGRKRELVDPEEYNKNLNKLTNAVIYCLRHSTF